MILHTLDHALNPAGCHHDLSQILSCVICGAPLRAEREEIDTCGADCWQRLRHLQVVNGRTLPLRAARFRLAAARAQGDPLR